MKHDVPIGPAYFKHFTINLLPASPLDIRYRSKELIKNLVFTKRVTYDLKVFKWKPKITLILVHSELLKPSRPLTLLPNFTFIVITILSAELT